MLKNFFSITLIFLFLGLVLTPSCKIFEKSKDTSIDSTTIISNTAVLVDTEYYMTVHKMPEFQGGDINTFVKYLHKQVKYPPAALKKKLQGLVAIQFGVDCYGKVRVFDVLKSSGSKSLDNEAKRVLAASPVWTPARLDNIAVGKLFVLQFKFTAATKKIEIK